MSEIIPNLSLRPSDIARFLVKVDAPGPGGCRLWNRSVDANGYGQFHLGTRTVKAHLVAWAIERGDFPPGLEPDHTCNVRRCAAIGHLEWVTHEENNRRIALRAEFCRAGLHRWADQVSVPIKGKRECRPCRNETKRRRYAENGQRQRVSPNAERDRVIREVFAAGESRRVIASQLGITYERVCQILRAVALG